MVLSDSTGPGRHISTLLAQVKEARQRAEDLLAYQETRPPQSLPYEITGLNLESVLEKSELPLKGFATLDSDLIASLLEVADNLRDYLEDRSRTRPHNLLLIARPGSGKSKLVECLADSLKIPFVNGDLSTLDKLSALTYVVNEARNFKAQDRDPLLFLDEVGSDISDYSTLLPLLWDGEMFVAGHVMRLGRCIIVCAVSDTNLESIDIQMTKPTSPIPKLSDFLSRFAAGVLKLASVNEPSRRLDKLCIVALLIKRRFKDVRYVSVGLLQFLASVPVEHEVRSIEALINTIPADAVKERSRGDQSSSPIPPGEKFISLLPEWNPAMRRRFVYLLDTLMQPGNPLRFHVRGGDLNRIQEKWKLYANNAGMVRI